MNYIGLSKKQTKEAIENKWCPFCKGKDFQATFDVAGQGFYFDEKGNVEWGEKSRDNVEIVECNICGEEIPSEIWKKWFKGEE